MINDLSMDQLDLIIGSSIAVIGIILGLWRYRITQKRKKSERAASQLIRLSSDPELEACLKFLDWTARPVQLPEKYLAIYKEGVLNHSYESLEGAMKPKSLKGSSNRQDLVYTDIFNRFFSFLEEINHDINIGLIVKSDVSSLKYWLEQIAGPRFLEEKRHSFFVEYLQLYGYSGVLELLEKFGLDIKTAA